MKLARTEIFDKPIFAFIGAALMTTCAYGVLHLLIWLGVPDLGFVFELLTQRGLTQYLTMWLFFTVSICLWQRWVSYREETPAMSVNMGRIAKEPISAERAGKIEESMPERIRKTAFGRRCSELLIAHKRGENVGELKSELSRSYEEAQENGYSLIDALKYLILLSGFIGTILGFSRQMMTMQIRGLGANAEDLSNTIIESAKHLSVAFDTTLLALGLTVVLILATHVLKGSEKKLGIKIEDKLNSMVRLFVSEPKGDPAEAFLKDEVADRFLNRLEAGLDRLAEKVLVDRIDHIVEAVAAVLTEGMKTWESRISDSVKELVDVVAAQSDAVIKAVEALHGDLMGKFGATEGKFNEVALGVRDVASALANQNGNVVKAIHDSRSQLVAEIGSMRDKLEDASLSNHRVVIQRIKNGNGEGSHI